MERAGNITAGLTGAEFTGALVCVYMPSSTINHVLVLEENIDSEYN